MALWSAAACCRFGSAKQFDLPNEREAPILRVHNLRLSAEPKRQQAVALQRCDSQRLWSAGACRRFGGAKQAMPSGNPFSQATVVGRSKAAASCRTPKAVCDELGEPRPAPCTQAVTDVKYRKDTAQDYVHDGLSESYL